MRIYALPHPLLHDHTPNTMFAQKSGGTLAPLAPLPLSTTLPCNKKCTSDPLSTFWEGLTLPSCLLLPLKSLTLFQVFYCCWAGPGSEVAKGLDTGLAFSFTLTLIYSFRHTGPCMEGISLVNHAPFCKPIIVQYSVT